MILRIAKFIFILLLIMSFISCDFFYKNRKILKEEKEKFLTFLYERFDYIKNLSKILASEADIVKIYKNLKEEAGNIKSLDSKGELIKSYGQKLKEVFNEIVRKYERDIGLPVRYSFYLPPGRVWLIPDKPLGEDIPFEDKSKEKPFLTEIFRNGKIFSGLITEREGLIYSAITPILNEKGEIIGAIEAWVNFLYILENYLSNNPKTKIIVFLNKEQKEILVTWPEQYTYNKGVLFYQNVGNIDYKKISETIFETKNDEIVKLNDKEFIVIDLKDFSDIEIGKLLLSVY